MFLVLRWWVGGGGICYEAIDNTPAKKFRDLDPKACALFFHTISLFIISCAKSKYFGLSNLHFLNHQLNLCQLSHLFLCLFSVVLAFLKHWSPLQDYNGRENRRQTSFGPIASPEPNLVFSR